MKRLSLFIICSLFFCSTIVEAQKQYNYSVVPNDPLKTRIYTLENGLTVMMSVYKDAPRIQTYVAIKAGSKNDPAETTGLAHYFEHIMFKGTSKFGTSNWEKEKPLIAAVSDLYEIFRKTTDEAKRDEIYHQIDSISYQASLIAIPNEYDKLMSAIGANGTNAFTSVDQTVYVEDIPSNQLENWSKIQSNRFIDPIFRLFHTELETIYEEKNMTLTKDSRKVYEHLLKGLFPHHPYGTQTTIGEAEHIKNPSMKNIQIFHDNYYVPNNAAICISGDFNPDEAIQVIDKYFGEWKPVTVPKFSFTKESKSTEITKIDVKGQDAENISIAWRFDGANSNDADMITLIDMILTNGTAGLIDLNLNKKQACINAGSSPQIMADYSFLMLTGKPKTGQTLEQVEQLLLGQVELVKKGEFPDWLIEAAINDLRLREIKEHEANESRAMAMVDAFTSGISWERKVTLLDRLSKITKQQIVDYAKQNLLNNYVVVYKRVGKDESVKKVKKPKITPIFINRELESNFLKSIKESTAKPIEPVFVDFETAIKKSILPNNNIPVLYIANEENNTFSLEYKFDMGANNDRYLSIESQYIKFLGTTSISPEVLTQEFYKIGCTWDMSVTRDEMTLKLSGLNQNFVKALDLFEGYIQDVKADTAALNKMIEGVLKKRADAKKNQQSLQSALFAYGFFGKNSPSTNVLSEKELKKIDANMLISKIKDVFSYPHKIYYYGPSSLADLTNVLKEHHQAPVAFKSIPVAKVYTEQSTDKNIVYHLDYPARQAVVVLLSKGGKYDKSIEPILTLFNEYFGGSMNSIVFQELREARSLAYTAMSFYQKPIDLKYSFFSLSYIATQNDKVIDAMKAIKELLNNMPLSDKSFLLAKDGIIQRLRTERITKGSIFDTYDANNKMGINYDIRKDIYEKMSTFTIADVKKFQEEKLKDKNSIILILGDKKDLNFKEISKFGKIKTITPEMVFGF
ncbi:MAG: insulinase family protein [Bacteroidota bacterium]